MNKAIKQSDGRINRIHKQCHECLASINQHCEGKPPSRPKMVWGTIKENKLSGLNFCSRYELDERLYVYPHKMPTFKSIRTAAVKRRVKKAEHKEAEEHIDLVDMAQNLNLKDLEHLL